MTTENLSALAAVEDGEDRQRSPRDHRLARGAPGSALVGGVCAGVADYLEIEALVGVRQSIVERMGRHGGRAEIHAQPGRGTEIELVMERG